MKNSLCYMDNIPFYCTSFKEKKDVHHEVLEFITDHPPEPVLYNESYNSYELEGFVMNPLHRDLFLKLKKKDVSLFFEDIGFKNAIIVSSSKSLNQDESGVLTLSFNLIEDLTPKNNWYSKIHHKIESFHDVIDDMAMKAYAALAEITKVSYTLGRSLELLDKAFALSKDFAFSMNHFRDKKNKLFQTPEDIKKTVVTFISSFTDQEKKDVTNKILKDISLPNPFKVIVFSEVSKILKDHDLEDILFVLLDVVDQNIAKKILLSYKKSDDLLVKKSPIQESKNALLLSFNSFGTVEKVDDIARLNGGVFYCTITQ